MNYENSYIAHICLQNIRTGIKSKTTNKRSLKWESTAEDQSESSTPSRSGEKKLKQSYKNPPISKRIFLTWQYFKQLKTKWNTDVFQKYICCLTQKEL